MMWMWDLVNAKIVFYIISDVGEADEDEEGMVHISLGSVTDQVANTISSSRGFGRQDTTGFGERWEEPSLSDWLISP